MNAEDKKKIESAKSVGAPAAIIVSCIIAAVLVQPLSKLLLEPRKIARVWPPGDIKWLDLRAKEMIRTGSAQLRQPSSIRTVDKLQNGFV